MLSPIVPVRPPPSPAAFLGWTPWGASDPSARCPAWPLSCISFRMALSTPSERVLDDRA